MKTTTIFIKPIALKILEDREPRCAIVQNVKNLDEDFFKDEEVIECILIPKHELEASRRVSFDFNYMFTWKKFKKLFSK